MSALRRLSRNLLALFVADTMLAAFVPAWIFALWAAGAILRARPVLLDAFLAAGPIAALCWSVRHAARGIRRGADRP